MWQWEDKHPADRQINGRAVCRELKRRGRGERRAAEEREERGERRGEEEVEETRGEQRKGEKKKER